MKVHLDDYHAQVSANLAAEFDWLKSVECYPAIDNKVNAPIAFLSVSAWEKHADQPANGQLRVTLQCEVTLLIDFSMENAEMLVRNAAMAIGLHLDSNAMAIGGARPAQFLHAMPEGRYPELDEYAVWTVFYQQSVLVGDDAFSEGVRGAIRAGVNLADHDDGSQYTPVG
ncbi:hypothetical protein [Pseudoalteromonas rubra]|uniref:hypothetical protein n=1 Tax=Pseudoalteromonas rubra TaxID=43658 RepID=UPI000F784BEF|nr:hypothetical protein [Pseudoalteromonas rubra]